MSGDVSMGQITQDFINRVKEFELHQMVCPFKSYKPRNDLIKWPDHYDTMKHGSNVATLETVRPAKKLRQDFRYGDIIKLIILC